MMRLKRRVQAASVGSRTYPAPFGGWNARDEITSLQPGEASALVNWFPDESTVEARGGYDEHATGLGGNVESLMPYHDGSTDKLLAAANGNIYEAGGSGAVGAALASSLGSSRFQHVNFGTAGGQYLVMCNGEDAVRYYNGTAITTTISGTAITGTGLTNSDLIHVNSFKRRLFFCEKDTLRFWYLAVNSLTGTASSFDLGGLCRRGGFLMAMATWTRDGGDGIDDLAVFITSRGELIVYQGTDPGSASSWSMVGRFDVGAPIGRRCFLRYGGELIIITQDGFVPISPLLANARTDERLAISSRISGAVTEQIIANSGRDGWEAIIYPRGNYVLFNIPQSSTKSIQYVMNTSTGAWCSFSGMNAFSWAVYNDDLYFGGNGKTYKADQGYDDAGADIELYVTGAPQYFDHRGRQKRFTMVRPTFRTKGNLQPRIALRTDYKSVTAGSAPAFSGSSGTPWGSPWGSEWSNSDKIIQRWYPTSGYGYNAQIDMRFNTKTRVSWLSTDWTYEMGGVL